MFSVKIFVVGCLLFIGIISFIVSVALKIHGKKLAKNCVGSCMAEVVDMKRRAGSDHMNDSPGIHYSYFPVFKYIVDGKEYKAETTMGKELNKVPQIGERINIFYNPVNPKEILVPGDDKLFKIVSVVMLITGIVLTIAAILSYRFVDIV